MADDLMSKIVTSRAYRRNHRVDPNGRHSYHVERNMFLFDSVAFDIRHAYCQKFLSLSLIIVLLGNNINFRNKSEITLLNFFDFFQSRNESRLLFIH